MEDYKMPNFEQWLDWLDKNHGGNYKVNEYYGCNEIVVDAPGYHNVELHFNEDEELIGLGVY